MRKLKYVLLSLMLMFPLSVNAAAVEDVDYTIESVYISSDVDILGSMHVKEAVIIKGALNGFDTNINYKNAGLAEWTPGSIDYANSSFYNARGVDISHIAAMKITEDQVGWDVLSLEYEDAEKVDYASKGDMNKYTEETTSNGKHILLYNSNEFGYVVYYFDYYINQAVVLHNDVAELYWTFLPQDFDYVKNVHIQLTIPQECTNDTFRFWAHGALNGNVSGISENKDSDGKNLFKGVLAEVQDVTDGSGVDIRMTFDKSIMSAVTSVLNNSEEDALDKIIAVETERANEANSQRNMIKAIFYTFLALDIAYLVVLVIIWIYVYNKHDKEIKSNFQALYFREFIDDYDVEVIDYLMKKDITTNAMSASIMNLIYKKNIGFEEIADDKKNFKLNLLNRDNVSESEGLLLDLLFNEVAKGDSLTSKELENYSSSSKTCEKFMSSYNRWKSNVKDVGVKKGFYEDLAHVRGVASLYFILGIVLIIFNFWLDVELYLLIGLIAIGTFAFLIYIATFNKMTNKGREHFLRWKAFKNFLKDFGQFKDKDIPEVKLWERYLVYATIFGLAKEVQKSMNVYLTDMDEVSRSYVPVYMYHNYYISDRINHTVATSYTGSQNRIAAINAASASSSGSGFGGGFSGGGGFGGGGGSGHGF